MSERNFFSVPALSRCWFYSSPVPVLSQSWFYSGLGSDSDPIPVPVLSRSWSYSNPDCIPVLVLIISRFRPYPGPISVPARKFWCRDYFVHLYLNHFCISLELKKASLWNVVVVLRHLPWKLDQKNITDHESTIETDWSASIPIKFEHTSISQTLLCRMVKTADRYLFSFSSCWEDTHTDELFG
jgi:hypothetical protein